MSQQEMESRKSSMQICGHLAPMWLLVTATELGVALSPAYIARCRDATPWFKIYLIERLNSIELCRRASDNLVNRAKFPKGSAFSVVDARFDLRKVRSS